jgi:predicted DNA-binding transcriptional regulator AlpA
MREQTGAGTHVIYPSGLLARWGITASTLWRWEKSKRIPARDFFIGGEAVGWRPETIEAHERGVDTMLHPHQIRRGIE